MSKKPFDVDALWALARLGEPSLSPDGSEAVASVTRYDMASNQSPKQPVPLLDPGASAQAPDRMWRQGRRAAVEP